jgi:glycosyltransferase involved in cell wall biosynthesis
MNSTQADIGSGSFYTAAMKDGIRARDLRIVILSDALRDRNGVDAYYRDLARQLRCRVHTLELLSPNPEDGDLRGSFHIPLPGDDTQQLVFPNARKLSARLHELKPHVIIAATNGPFGLWSMYGAKRVKARLIAGFHTHIEGLCDMYWGGVMGTVLRGWMEAQNKLLFRQATHIVVNSPAMTESAALLSRTPVALMGTPLERAFIDTPLNEAPSQISRVLFAGRLAPEKNIEAFCQAAEDFPQLQFTIAGEGPLRDQVTGEAKRLANLDYLGRLSRDEMVSRIDSHDLLVLPSHLEAFGTIAMEGMARQRLVLVSRNCGILAWSELRKGLFKFSNDESLTESIQRLLELAGEQLQQHAVIARHAALELHEQALENWLELLENTANG